MSSSTSTLQSTSYAQNVFLQGQDFVIEADTQFNSKQIDSKKNVLSERIFWSSSEIDPIRLLQLLPN